MRRNVSFFQSEVAPEGFDDGSISMLTVQIGWRISDTSPLPLQVANGPDAFRSCSGKGNYYWMAAWLRSTSFDPESGVRIRQGWKHRAFSQTILQRVGVLLLTSGADFHFLAHANQLWAAGILSLRSKNDPRRLCLRMRAVIRCRLHFIDHARGFV